VKRQKRFNIGATSRKLGSFLEKFIAAHRDKVRQALLKHTEPLNPGLIGADHSSGRPYDNEFEVSNWQLSQGIFYFFGVSGFVAGGGGAAGILKLASSMGTLISIFSSVSFCFCGLPFWPVSIAKGNIMPFTSL